MKSLAGSLFSYNLSLGCCFSFQKNLMQRQVRQNLPFQLQGPPGFTWATETGVFFPEFLM